MDNEQLQQLATNATLSHWPPHLGVTTEAEKVEYLAQRLRESAERESDTSNNVGALETRVEDLSLELHESEKEVERLEAKVVELEQDVKRHESTLNEIVRLAQQ